MIYLSVNEINIMIRCQLYPRHIPTALFKDFIHKLQLQRAQDSTPPNPSTNDVMVGSPSKKQIRARDMLQSFRNLFLVKLVIHCEFERL